MNTKKNTKKIILSNKDFEDAINQYAIYGAGFRTDKTRGLDRLLRPSNGQKLWENMTQEERFNEFKNYAKHDFAQAKKEAGNQPVEYILDRALDPLDPMAGMYKIVLKRHGAKIKGNKIKLPGKLQIKIK